VYECKLHGSDLSYSKTVSVAAIDAVIVVLPESTEVTVSTLGAVR
jgi:hypothetical protein